MCYFYYFKLLHIMRQQCACSTYGNDIESVVTHFSDLSVLVMHQIYQVGWSLYREG